MKKLLLLFFAISMVAGSVSFANTNIANTTSEASISFTEKGSITFYDYSSSLGEQSGLAQLYLGSDGRYYLGFGYSETRYLLTNNTYRTFNGYNVAGFRYICNVNSQIYFIRNL